MSFDRSLTRGPLPASVYWRRRAAVLGIVLLLMIGFARLFGGGDDTGAAAATNTASETTQTPVVPENIGAPAVGESSSAAATVTPTPTVAASPATSLPAVAAALPTPTGKCSDDDVTITAAVPKAEATRTVAINLTLKTNVTAACLWQFSAKTVQVEITSGSDQIWSTVDCPKALTSSTLTLRRDTPVNVTVKWNSRRSDSDCSTHTQWAARGYYHVQVAALGGEPADVQFRLVKPAAAVATTPSASATPTTAASGAASGTSSKNPTTRGTRSEPTSVPDFVD